jgi:hypothetical protein
MITNKQKMNQFFKKAAEEYQGPSIQQKVIKYGLSKKYMISQDYSYSRVTSNIMYNEPKNLVSVFKDYLIYDDFSEYLKRQYR